MTSTRLSSNRRTSSLDRHLGEPGLERALFSGGVGSDLTIQGGSSGTCSCEARTPPAWSSGRGGGRGRLSEGGERMKRKSELMPTTEGGPHQQGSDARLGRRQGECRSGRAGRMGWWESGAEEGRPRHPRDGRKSENGEGGATGAEASNLRAVPVRARPGGASSTPIPINAVIRVCAACEVYSEGGHRG